MNRLLALVLIGVGIIVVSIGVTNAIRADTPYCNLYLQLAGSPPSPAGWRCDGDCADHGGGVCHDWPYQYPDGSTGMKCKCDHPIGVVCHTAFREYWDGSWSAWCEGQDWACPPPTEECDWANGATTEVYCECK